MVYLEGELEKITREKTKLNYSALLIKPFFKYILIEKFYKIFKKLFKNLFKNCFI